MRVKLLLELTLQLGGVYLCVNMCYGDQTLDLGVLPNDATRYKYQPTNAHTHVNCDELTPNPQYITSRDQQNKAFIYILGFLFFFLFEVSDL